MFTGMLEEMGTVRRLDRTPISCRLTIAATLVLQGTQIGDSIAVNGVCLTVTDLQKDAFTADVMSGKLHAAVVLAFYVVAVPSTWNVQWLQMVDSADTLLAVTLMERERLPAKYRREMLRLSPFPLPRICCVILWKRGRLPLTASA